MEKNRFDDFEHDENPEEKNIPEEKNEFENKVEPVVKNQFDDFNSNSNNNSNTGNRNMPPIGGGMETLPNSIGILVMGILSIVLCWCYGIPGIALGIISLVMSKKAFELYESSPGKYTEASFKNVKTGKILAFVGLGVSALYIIYVIAMFVIAGSGGFGNSFGSYY